MTTFRNSLHLYDHKDVVATIEAMQKKIEFCHDNGIDMLKLGWTRANLANICLPNPTDFEFYPLCSSDSDLHEKKTGKDLIESS